MKSRPVLSSVALIALACGDEVTRAPLEPPRFGAMEVQKGWSIDEKDRTDESDNSIVGLFARLHSLDRVLDVLVARMHAIDATFGPPPDDDRDDFSAVLTRIQVRAQYIHDVATFLGACGDVVRPPSMAGSSGEVAQADLGDSDNASSAGLLGRLGSVANVLDALTKRVDDIDAAAEGICLPEGGPEPWSPPTISDLLVSIQTAALNVKRLAEELLQ